MKRKLITFLITAAAGLTCGVLISVFLKPHVIPPEAPPPSKPVTELREMNLEDDALSLEAFLSEAAGYTPPQDGELARWWSGKGSLHALLAAVDAGIALLRTPDDDASRRRLIELLNSSDPSFHAVVWPELMRRWAAAEPESAATAALELRDERARTTLLFEAFTQLGKRNVNAALIAAEALPAGNPHAAALTAIFQEKIKADSSAAAKLMLELETANRMKESLPWFMLIREWNDADPAAPLRWAMKIEDPAKRMDLMKRVFEVKNELIEDNEKVHSLLLELAADPRNAEALLRPASFLLSSSKVDGMEIYSALPAGTVKAQLLQSTVSSDLLFESQKLKPLLEKFNARGEAETFFRAGTEAAVNEGKEGLQRWGAWLAGADSGTEPVAALENLAREAAERTPFAAAEWLGTLKPSPERDRAVKAFAEIHAAADAERALAWAESIQDATLRAETVKKVQAPAPRASNH